MQVPFFSFCSLIIENLVDGHKVSLNWLHYCTKILGDYKKVVKYLQAFQTASYSYRIMISFHLVMHTLC